MECRGIGYPRQFDCHNSLNHAVLLVLLVPIIRQTVLKARGGGHCDSKHM